MNSTHAAALIASLFRVLAAKPGGTHRSRLVECGHEFALRATPTTYELWVKHPRNGSLSPAATATVTSALRPHAPTPPHHEQRKDRSGDPITVFVILRRPTR